MGRSEGLIDTWLIVCCVSVNLWRAVLLQVLIIRTSEIAVLIVLSTLLHHNIIIPC